MAKSRMIFIPQLKAKLKANLISQGVSEKTIDASFAKWEAGFEPNGPWEAGCYAVFEDVQRQIDAE